MYPRTGLGVRALLLAVAAGCRSIEATSTPLVLAVSALPVAALRVACLGDSITRGDTKHEPKKEQDKDKYERGNWPRYVSQDSDAVEAKNFGQSGVMVLRGKKQYTDTDIYQEVVAWAPDIAIIWLGINDAKEKDNGKFKRKQFIDDYRDMLKQLTGDIDNLDAIYIIKQYPIVDDCCDIHFDFVNEDLPLAIEEVVDKGAMRGVPVNIIDLDWNARTGCLDGVKEDDQDDDCLKYYDSDGVHTSQKGSRLVAESVLLALFPPSPRPTSRPSRLPTRMPTREPSRRPTLEPSREPTRPPTREPSLPPVQEPRTSEPSPRATPRPTEPSCARVEPVDASDCPPANLLLPICSAKGLQVGDLCRGDDVCGDAALSNCRRRRLQDREDDIIVGLAIYRVVVAAPRPTAAPVAEPTLRPTTARPIWGDDDDDDDARPDVPARTRAPTLRGTSSPTRDGGAKKNSSKSRATLTIGLAAVGAGTVLLLFVLLVVCLCKRDEGPEIGFDGTRKGFLPPGAARSPRTPATRQVTRSGSDLGGASPRRDHRGERSVTVDDEFDALATALERARALDSSKSPPRRSELDRHFSGNRRGRRSLGRRSAPTAEGTARGHQYWRDRQPQNSSEGRRQDAHYWRDRARATEDHTSRAHPPMTSASRRGRCATSPLREGRKVSPHRDPPDPVYSAPRGSRRKDDRRHRREAAVWTP